MRTGMRTAVGRVSMNPAVKPAPRRWRSPGPPRSQRGHRPTVAQTGRRNGQERLMTPRPDPTARRVGQLPTVGPPDRRVLRVYLGDHLTGADAATARVQWMAQRYADEPWGGGVGEVADGIAHDRAALVDMTRRLGISPPIPRRWLGRLGERVGRLKLNGRVARTSPLTPVVELEALRSGIAAKRSLWATLEVWAGPLGLDARRLAELGARADAQLATVERTLQAVRPNAFVRAPQERAT
jgi:hypothetical protein